MTHDTRNRVVLVTGASSGIGAATARLLAASGARVILVARRFALLEEVRLSLPDAPTHLSLAVDVTDGAAIDACIETALQRYGRIDAVVINAGIGLTAPVAHMAYHDFLQVLAVNVGGFLHFTRSLTPVFARVGNGQFIVVTSVVAQHALPYNGGYAASKAALERLCEALRIESRGTGVAVTVVRPGTVATGFFAQRIGQPGEHRALTPVGMAPDTVARSILHALTHRPRVVYPRRRDWIIGVFADLFPALSDAVLARSITWRKKTGDDAMSSPEERT